MWSLRLKLIDAVLASDVRLFIFSSSCATYGVPQRLPIEESSPKNPINPYGVTKLFLEQVLSAYRYSHGLQHVCLRYFNAAGAHPSGEIGEYHDPETHLIPLALKAVLGTSRPAQSIWQRSADTGWDLHPRFCACFGSGPSPRQGAGVSGRRRGIDRVEPGIGQGYFDWFLTRHGRENHWPRGSTRVCRQPPGRPPALYADPSLARRVLGWAPEFDLESILRSAWEWESSRVAAFLACG